MAEASTEDDCRGKQIRLTAHYCSRALPDAVRYCKVGRTREPLPGSALIQSSHPKHLPAHSSILGRTKAPFRLGYGHLSQQFSNAQSITKSLHHLSTEPPGQFSITGGLLYRIVLVTITIHEHQRQALGDSTRSRQSVRLYIPGPRMGALFVGATNTHTHLERTLAEFAASSFDVFLDSSTCLRTRPVHITVSSPPYCRWDIVVRPLFRDSDSTKLRCTCRHRPL